MVHLNRFRPDNANAQTGMGFCVSKPFEHVAAKIILLYKTCSIIIILVTPMA